ncbi:MAG: Hsp20/alpha crystallin family protein [Cyanobacteria bacterium P01_F01_bin.53]
MALVRWSPARELDTLQREMNRLFEDTFSLSNHSSRGLSGFSPAAELFETEEGYQLKLEIPGMDADDLDIQVTAETVSISGERKSESTHEENGMTRSEFRYGSFQRVMPLPGRIDHQNVVADYKDGILNLSMAKAEEEKNKVVKVSVK